MREINTRLGIKLGLALGLVSLWPALFLRAATASSQTDPFVLSSQQSWLGVTLQDVTAAKARELKLPGVYGAIVTSVEPNSPAEKAGVKKNDVILKFAGRRVWSVAALARRVHETPPGRVVNLLISRSGKKITLQATIESHPAPFFPEGAIPGYPNFSIKMLPPMASLPPGSLPERHFRVEPLPPSTPNNNPWLSPGRVLGIIGETLTPQLARFFGVEQGKGVLVASVIPNSPATKAGLKAGDVIIKVGALEVTSVSSLRSALQSQQSQSHQVFLTIVRNRQEKTVSAVLKPLGSKELRSAENWGLTPAAHARLAKEIGKLTAEVQALAAKYQPGSANYQALVKQARQAAKEYEAKAAQYKKQFQVMRQQLR
jgi:membrane-associated protease RseP (regulator of RpoE activity)